jgi:hypothetical protein
LQLMTEGRCPRGLDSYNLFALMYVATGPVFCNAFYPLMSDTR